MNTPHKHAALIIAWANGATIECQNRTTEEWGEMTGPGEDVQPKWFNDFEYRIKPAPQISDKARDLINDIGSAAANVEWSKEFGTANSNATAANRYEAADKELRKFILDLEQKVLDINRTSN